MFNSGGYDRTYAVKHGLSAALKRVDVIPYVSSDTKQVVGVKNLSGEIFEFKSVPRGGSGDKENAADF